MLTRASASAQRERMPRLVVAKVGGHGVSHRARSTSGGSAMFRSRTREARNSTSWGARKRNPFGTSTTFSTFSTACWAWKPTTSSVISGSSASVTHARRSLSARCDRTPVAGAPRGEHPVPPRLADLPRDEPSRAAGGGGMWYHEAGARTRRDDRRPRLGPRLLPDGAKRARAPVRARRAPAPRGPRAPVRVGELAAPAAGARGGGHP